jgi:hypothetical protein
MRVPDLRAIPHLRVTVDGVRQGRCANVTLAADELFWPEGHDVFPAGSEEYS